MEIEYGFNADAARIATYRKYGFIEHNAHRFEPRNASSLDRPVLNSHFKFWLKRLIGFKQSAYSQRKR